MDTLDIKILRELGRGESPGLPANPRIPLRSLARRLGVDKDTVSSRLKRFREAGALHGWATVVNPNLLDAKLTRLLFDVPTPSSKEELIRNASLIPGAVLITPLLGNSVEILLFYEDDQSLRKTIELISRTSHAENLIRIDSDFPECKLKLSRTDWSIIESLQKDPRKPFSLISMELGLSNRTIRRRLVRLLDGMALGAFPRLDLSALDATVVHLLAAYTRPEQRGDVNNRILAQFEDSLLMADLGGRSHGLFILIITNAARVKEIREWMRSQSGVSSYRVDLILDHLEVPGALSRLIERSLGRIQVPA